MLTLYRLHKTDCKKGYKRLDRAGLNCACPVHVEGKLGSEFLRRSTKTQSMEKARALVVAAEERGVWDAPQPAGVVGDRELSSKAVANAVDAYLEEISSRRGKNLASPTVSKYRTLLTRLKNYADRRGIVEMDELTFEELTRFKDSWPYRAIDPVRNCITRLRKFYKFSVQMKWCKENVAASLEMPREESLERLPFTPEEELRIYHAARTMRLDPQQPITRDELLTFCYLMRFSGMAIADASLLQRSEIRGDEVRYYRKKTRRMARRLLVVVPVPHWLTERLESLPLHQGRYFFCHGSDLLVSAVDVWHNRLRHLFDAAGLPNGTAHRFRHTFATTLLESGETLEDVSRWLGHASTKTTERYYSHWIESRVKASSDKLRRRYASSVEHVPGA